MAASRSDQGIDLLKSDLKKRVERISNVLGLTFKLGFQVQHPSLEAP